MMRTLAMQKGLGQPGSVSMQDGDERTKKRQCPESEVNKWISKCQLNPRTALKLPDDVALHTSR